MGWRTVSETVLQKTPAGLANRNFKATSNGRNEQMFREVSDFAANIKILEKDMDKILKHLETHFKNLRCILVSPLPALYGQQGDEVYCLEPERRILGANMDVEGIPRSAEEARRRMQEEVIVPFHEWMHCYNQTADRMQRLEKLRLELDSRRRTVDNLHGKLQRIQAGLGSRGEKGEVMLRETKDLHDRKATKMQNAADKFAEDEYTVYSSLSALIRDADSLKDYTQKCLQIVQEAFMSAARSYETVSMPVAGSTTGGTTYPPTNKYDTPVGGTDRPTPRGIVTGLFDKLRGKSGRIPSSPKPTSPMISRDAPEQPDQAQYHGNLYSQNSMPASYNQYQGQPNRRTQDTDISAAPSNIPYQGQQYTNNYNPASMYAPASTNNYVPAGNATYQPQHTGGSGYGGSGKFAPSAPQQQGGRVYAQQPSIKYGQEGEMYGYSSGRYTQGIPAATNMSAGSGGWTQDGR